jgi:hypothetical protein
MLCELIALVTRRAVDANRLSAAALPSGSSITQRVDRSLGAASSRGFDELAEYCRETTPKLALTASD